MNPNSEHYVYRLFDADDQLLYVGCTHDMAMRMRYHKYRTPWFSEVARTEVETHPNRQAALDAEIVAIVLERPLRNKAYMHWHPDMVRAMQTVRPKASKVAGLAGQTPRSARRAS